MQWDMRKVLLGLGLAVVVLMGAYAFGLFESERPQAQAGQCASISGSADSPRFTTMDCAADKANVKVAKVVERSSDGCPKGGSTYSTFTSGVTLCLMPNFVEGSCYRTDVEAGLVKVACGTPESVKVAKVVNGAAPCDNQRAVAYPEPAVTFCLAKGDA
jgi:hypothetical protein